MDTLLEKYEEWAVKDRGRKKGLSESSVAKYLRYIKTYVNEYGHPGYTTERDISDWRESIELTDKGEPAASSTINTKTAAIRSLFSFMVDVGAISEDPTADLSYLTPDDFEPIPLSDRDVEKMMNELARAPLNDQALIETLYGSGLRRSEAAVLRLVNIVDDSTIELRGKGKRKRRTMLTAQAYELLKKIAIRTYGDEQTAEILETKTEDLAFWDLKERFPTAPLFHTATGTPYVECKHPGNEVYRVVTGLAEKAGVKASPHQWRHTFATGLLNEGADIRMIQDAMGHKNIKQTQNYTKVTTRGLKKLKNYHPRTLQGA